MGEITYWILPYSNKGSVWGSDFNDEALEEYNDSKKTITYDFNQLNYILPHNGKHQVRIALPYDGFDDGEYTICIKARDSSDNYSYEFQRIFNKLINEKLSYLVENDKIIFTNTFAPAIATSAGFYYLDIEDNYDNAPIRWIFTDRVENIHIDNDNNNETHTYIAAIPQSLFGRWGRIVCYRSIGYYDVEYVYLDYLLAKTAGTQNTLFPIDQKNIISGLNGLQIYCDQPTLVHTLYCSKKLSETSEEEDIAVWENKGIETGIVVKNSNFSYSKDYYYDNIPSGAYYTTVVHFVDGTKVMSEVKQKP